DRKSTRLNSSHVKISYAVFCLKKKTPTREVATWTAAENKAFENALAVYDDNTPDRWQKVAAVIPGKTVSDVIRQYNELEADVSNIEAGLIPVPGYISSPPFTLDWAGGGGGCTGFFSFY